MHSFGSYSFASLVVSNYYKWILLSPNKGCPSGLFYEDTSPRTAIMRLGVISDGTPARAASLQPQYHNCNLPSPSIGSPNSGLFLSIAVFTGLKRVDLCHINKRCTGMLIHYIDGLTRVLGQWHTSHGSQHSCIYNGNEPDITKIYFEMAASDNCQIVTNVTLLPNISTITPACSQVFDVEEVRFSA